MHKKPAPAMASTLVIAISMLLLGCTSTRNDATIKKLLVGTWRLDQEPSKTIQNKPDGSYVIQFARGGSNIVVEGTWNVKSGFVIATMTNAPSWFGPQDPTARHNAESNKVVHIDGHRVLFLSSQDGTTPLTAHKQ